MNTSVEDNMQDSWFKKSLFIRSMCMSVTYKDVHQHVQRQSVLLSGPAVPRSDFLTVLLGKPRNLLHIFSDVSHLVLLHKRICKHRYAVREQARKDSEFVINKIRKK